ncbi:hypothetical protein CEUSTIGMA_g1315.t1 [Chlamydomonas eustigma]|uniref:Uncharacterized protein n=1 Tax=Chlamydomonas eustigma TaxID=1157962 RepID=A0A250WSR4_9CHLO|nr:hypothetical protein CEUSTIGMA_g1315.t1 [Chlamydomonas eustigma]|eukprot:GAX73865.1 hypothetical protein CEUSTIGMA_g1315.t1 [Chlamydomonas eustigma]
MGNFSSSSSSKKGNISAAPQAQITEVDRTILSLKTQRNKLNDQQKLLETRIDRHQEVARTLLKEGRKDRALMALKKKKMTENQLSQLTAHILNVEGLLSSIETSKQQVRMVEALQKGTEALKQLQKLLSVDDVKKLMEDTAEAKAYQDELKQLLGQSLSTEDDEAVAAEMSALEEEELQLQLAEFPKVPETQPTIVHKVVNANEVAKSLDDEQAEEEREAPPMLAA